MRTDMALARTRSEPFALAGSIDVVGAASLLQCFETASSSGRLHFESRVGCGILEIDDGMITNAEATVLEGPLHLLGEDAALLFIWTSAGSFWFEARPPCSVLSGPTPTLLNTAMIIHSLLLDAAVLEDELERVRAFLPGPRDRVRIINAGVLGPKTKLEAREWRIDALARELGIGLFRCQALVGAALASGTATGVENEVGRQRAVARKRPRKSGFAKPAAAAKVSSHGPSSKSPGPRRTM
jgi:hypothetical protein